mmetsp:Transcript_20613/g.33467  ORF Transcript_20613/g.33467 Transcript_20613/m.33467 type:complete len:202 (+) Transcript_20613:719-1324(+)
MARLIVAYRDGDVEQGGSAFPVCTPTTFTPLPTPDDCGNFACLLRNFTHHLATGVHHPYIPAGGVKRQRGEPPKPNSCAHAIEVALELRLCVVPFRVFPVVFCGLSAKSSCDRGHVASCGVDSPNGLEAVVDDVEHARDVLIEEEEPDLVERRVGPYPVPNIGIAAHVAEPGLYPEISGYVRLHGALLPIFEPHLCDVGQH